jgi:hypothetical protein
MPDVSLELFYDGAWRDVVADDDVLTRAPIVMRRGQGDESQAPRPAQLTATLANDDDRYRTSNPESPLYGKAGRNTPTRVVVDGDVRTVVEASSWVSSQSRDFRRFPRRGSAQTELEAGGLLQRVNQWTTPLKSAFRYYNDTITGAIGYWPAEQERGSTTLVSTIDGTKQQGGFTGAAFDSQYRAPGSAPLMDIEDGAGMGFYFAGANSATSTTGWQLSWVARHETLIPGEQTIMYWETGDNTAYGLYLDSTTGNAIVYSSKNGVPVLAAAWTYGDYDWSQWTLLSIEAHYAAGSTTISVNWTSADGKQSGFFNPSFPDVPASLRWWSVLGGDGEIPPGSTIGHIMGVPWDAAGGTDLFGGARQVAFRGYDNEKAAYRLNRLCNLFDITLFVSNNFELSARMGPQPVATLEEHFREIVDTEDGLLLDLQSQIALFFWCRADRYARDVTLALTPHDLPALPPEVVDDLPIHNHVTVTQRDGAAATAVDATGPLGTLPPPDGAGEYRQNKDVNVTAPRFQLPQLANWYLRRGTVDLPRFPQVTVNLAALSPARRAQVAAVDVADVITIDNFREDLIRLHVLGYTETIGHPNARSITFVCAPDEQFDVAVYDDTSKRADSRTSTLSGSYSATATSMVVTFTDLRDQWSTTAVPYDWELAGERVTVTAMGAVTGSGPWTQTATVRRSVNGVRKPQVPGPVHIHRAQRARYAL